MNVVLDAIGGEVGMQSLHCLAPQGRMIVYGSLQDAATPLVTQMLIPKCLTVSRYNTVIQSQAEQQAASIDLLRSIASGQLKIIQERSYHLEDAPLAHKAIEAKKTRGKVVLDVAHT